MAQKQSPRNGRIAQNRPRRRKKKKVARPSTDIVQGSRVTWKWGLGHAIGRVSKLFHGKVTKVIRSAKITRNASVSKPAVLVKTDNGKNALKSVSELRQPPDHDSR